MAVKSSFLDKVLGRIGRLDAEGLQTVVQRLARERSFLETLFNTIEDGVLVEVSCGAVNRVTCAVFYHFARPMENSPDGLETFDTAPLMAGIRAVLGVMPDEDGWRQSRYEGKELWLVPNEVQGLTLMFPGDY